MKKEKVLNVAKEYATTVREIIDANAVFLYGSYAKGTAAKDSDIDIAVAVHILVESRPNNTSHRNHR